MTSTRSNVTIPDDPVTTLSGRGTKKSPESLATVTAASPPSSTSTTNESTANDDYNIKVPATGDDDDDTTNKDNDDDDDDDDNDKKQTSAPDAKANNKNDNKKKNTTKKSATDASTFDEELFCNFVFDTDPTRPLLAERLNSSFDLSFDSDVLFQADGSVVTDPPMAL